MPEEYINPQRRPRKRKRRSKFQRFVHRYFPSIMLVVLSVCCVSAVVFTIGTISNMAQNRPTDPQLNSHPSTTDTEPTDDTVTLQIEALIRQADKLAVGYDYTGAIALLEGFAGYETQTAITDKIAEYKEADKKLVSYSDLDNITHIFFHSLIADPSRAFDGDTEQDGFNLYMVTVTEFEKIMQSMYDRGYVLVSPYDIAYEVSDENGTRFVYGNIRLPEGKKPFLMSQDDVNYYGYMIGSGNGKDETPIFASMDGDGFASRIIIGEDGYPTCEYMDKDGNVTVGDYDLVPVLEKFIQEHPDFSYHGARAILGVTGYEGVFGYRTKPSYETALGTAAYQKEVEDAKKVAECLKEHGWILASHSYGHPAYGNLTPERVEADSTKWENTCEYIVGETDIILFPHGSDIGSFRNYAPDNEKFKILYEDGYRYFFNVDSKIAWTQIGENYYRASRRNIDGYRMFHHPEKLEDLFDVSKVFDSARPTPVPPLSGGM
ncbi:MAG: polysaccharide deacetylase [Oscillospiraceae bacterium]|nr:polysaccharide deacetylase [Oscillospiraceae bacterium]